MKAFKEQIDTNMYLYLLSRIAMLMVLYSFSRLVFIGLNDDLLQMNNTQMSNAMLGGMKFDISGVIYVNLLFILLCLIPFDFRHHKTYQKILHWTFMIFNAIGLGANLIDVNYFPYSLKRTTAVVFQEFANEARLGGGLGEAIWQFFPTFLVWVVMVIILHWFSKRVISTKPIFEKWYWNTVLGIGMGAAIIGLSIAGMRGGFRHSTRPITLANASKYIDKPIHRAAVLNTPFAIIRSLSSKPIKRVNFYDGHTEMNLYYNPAKTYKMDPAPAIKYDNVVVLVLESFGREHFGFYNKHIAGYSGFTPFLDSLMDHSYVFKRAFANGRKSIDALPAIISGIPKLERPFVLSHNSNNDIESIASFLKPQGYTSAFFHGAPNGSMGLDAFVNQAKYDHYYGMTEYGNDDEFDGLWGLWDEPFLDYMADQLDTLKRPFVATMFSLSSHHPFKVPEQYDGVFPKGKLPLQEPIGYTDNALRNFFEKAKEMSWYDHTLFVITNDHASGTDLPEYKTMVGYFAAPMILFHPGDSSLVGYNDTTVVQHLDIMPTVLTYLGHQKNYWSFGNNMFESPYEHYSYSNGHFAFNGINGVYQLIEGDYSLQHDGEKLLGIFNYIKDPLLEDNLKDTEFQGKEYLIRKFEAVFQQCSNRMLDNRLVGKNKSNRNPSGTIYLNNN